jgi:endonuclease III-like uncharacterized protein
MLIKGYAFYNSKKEKLQLWKEIKQEFNNYAVKVIIKDGIISYTAKVERGYI